MKNIEDTFDYAKKCYDTANCNYDGYNYFYHINMVKDILFIYRKVFKKTEDFEVTLYAAATHDCIEDAKQNYNDILNATGSKDVADITLAVTDVPAENRLMRHLLTMHKTVKDYRAIILKLCDMHANATYSKTIGSSMFNKYKEEYKYRRPIFQQALAWYIDELNQMALKEFWNELDEIHDFK